LAKSRCLRAAFARDDRRRAKADSLRELQKERQKNLELLSALIRREKKIVHTP
jgi:hypothetical protein